jgi:excisionase family DNA binding protein
MGPGQAEQEVAPGITGEIMTAKITLEKISAQEVRLTLVADIQISWDLNPLAPQEDTKATTASSPHAPKATGDGIQDQRLLTVEETAEALHISRDRTYYLLRTGQLRSIKIGKLRRISRTWIEEFIERQPLGRA